MQNRIREPGTEIYFCQFTVLPTKTNLLLVVYKAVCTSMSSPSCREGLIYKNQSTIQLNDAGIAFCECT